MLPSLRHFFRFIDLDDKFVAHGFYKKVSYLESCHEAEISAN
jgi:hypothetical protein